MIKVKEFLDRNFISSEKSTSELKTNGHYCVFGSWVYKSINFYYEGNTIPILEGNTLYKSIFYGTEIYKFTRDRLEIRCDCNNETLRILIRRNGKFIGKYSYLQTYSHIPRGEADENGYYARSTDEEIIKYLKSFLSDSIRNSKIYSILK